MRLNRATTIALAAALLLPSARWGWAAEFRPGEVIGKDQADRVKGYLPPSLEQDLRKGDLVIPIGPADPKNYHELPGFLAASEKNAGKYDLNEEDTLVDRSGKIPEFVYGWPFPNVKASDPKAALKLMWNYRYAAREDASVAFGVAWVGRNTGKEREFWAVVESLFWDGRATGPLPDNPNHLLRQERINVVSPSNVDGTVTLTWRYKGPRVDSFWAYSPAIRRVRQLTAANRSDAFLGSDFHIDNAAGFSGKIESFRYKLIGRRTMLVPLAKPKKPITWSPIEATGGWETPWNKNITEFRYERPGDDGGAPWFPYTWEFVPRDVWIIEGTPKDPYYNYGKFVFYMDSEIYQIYYVDEYTRAGEFWKIFTNVARRQNFPNDVVGFLFGCNIMIDYKADHASVTPGPPDPGIPQKYRHGPKPRNFDVGGILVRGK